MNRVPEEELEEQARDGRCHHNGARFTGVSVARYPTGEPEYENEYRDGLPWGPHRHYREDGGLLEEGTRIAGHQEGIWRTWHPSGRLASEEFCYFDFTLARMTWDPEGRVTEDYVMVEADPMFQKLQRYREGFGRTHEPIPAPPRLPTPEGAAFLRAGG